MVVEEKELDKGLDEEIKNEVDSEELNSDSTVSEESESEIVESEEAPEEDATSEAETTKKKSFLAGKKRKRQISFRKKLKNLRTE